MANIVVFSVSDILLATIHPIMQLLVDTKPEVSTAVGKLNKHLCKCENGRMLPRFVTLASIIKTIKGNLVCSSNEINRLRNNIIDIFHFTF